MGQKESVTKEKKSKKKDHKEWVFKESRGKDCHENEKSCKANLIDCKEKCKESNTKERVKKTVKTHRESAMKSETNDKTQAETNFIQKSNHDERQKKILAEAREAGKKEADQKKTYEVKAGYA